MAGVSSESAPVADFRSPDDQAKASDLERIAVYGEDWVTAPRRADCGERLGAESQAKVVALLARGTDEATIREAALSALSDEECRIIRRHRLRGWLVFALCVGTGIAAVVNWDGRGDGQALHQIILLGGIGLMLAHAVHMHGIRRRARLIRSATARKAVWRGAIDSLYANLK